MPKAKRDQVFEEPSPPTPTTKMGMLVAFVIDRGPKMGEKRPALVLEVKDKAFPDGIDEQNVPKTVTKQVATLYVFSDNLAGGDSFMPSNQAVKREVLAVEEAVDARGRWTTID